MSSTADLPSAILLSLIKGASFKEMSGETPIGDASASELLQWHGGISEFILFLRASLDSEKAKAALIIVARVALVIRDDHGRRVSPFNAFAPNSDNSGLKIGVRPDRLDQLCNMSKERHQRFCRQVQIGEPRFAEMVLLGL